MDLKELIYRRKSTRSYTGEPVDEATLQRIKDFSASAKPLYPDIKVRAEVVSREQVKCFLPWTPPQLLAIFSEEKEGFLENVGFIFQQLDLYMQSLGLGVCWLGMGKLSAKGAVETKRDDGLRYVIMLAFGHPKGDALRDTAQFKRRALSEISDQPDPRLEPARVAPSSVNSQPWYFTHEADAVHVHCVQQGFRVKFLGDMNRIDMGIALAHLYVAHPETFRFFRAEDTSARKGYGYVGSVSL